MRTVCVCNVYTIHIDENGNDELIGKGNFHICKERERKEININVNSLKRYPIELSL